MPEEHPSEVAFKTVMAHDYRVVPANGVWGGITPRGEILMHFYLECLAVPDEVVYEVSSGRVIGEKSRTAASFVRQMQVGVVVSVDQAESISRWLASKVADHRKSRGVEPSGDA